MRYQVELGPYDQGRIERGIGCASIVPAGFIGFAGLADYAGPTGWRGFSEFLGWAIVCVAAGFGVGSLLRLWRQSGRVRSVAVLLAMVAVALFTYALNWLNLGAPMTAKILFTTSLQIIGAFGTVGTMIWLGHLIRVVSYR